MAAAQTEARLGWQLGAAFGTDVGQRIPAGHAEPRAAWVFRFAIGTVHVRPFTSSVRSFWIFRIIQIFPFTRITPNRRSARGCGS